jgi:hypothetical protein
MSDTENGLQFKFLRPILNYQKTSGSKKAINTDVKTNTGGRVSAGLVIEKHERLLRYAGQELTSAALITPTVKI